MIKIILYVIAFVFLYRLSWSLFRLLGKTSEDRTKENKSGVKYKDAEFEDID